MKTEHLQLNKPMYLIGIFKLFLICLISFSAYGKNESGNTWFDLTSEQYFEELVSCESMLQEYKWSKNIWPKENKNSKPEFKDVVDIQRKLKGSVPFKT